MVDFTRLLSLVVFALVVVSTQARPQAEVVTTAPVVDDVTAKIDDSVETTASKVESVTPADETTTSGSDLLPPISTFATDIDTATEEPKAATTPEAADEAAMTTAEAKTEPAADVTPAAETTPEPSTAPEVEGEETSGEQEVRVPRIEEGEEESVTPAAETTPAAESVTPADESVTPAAETTPAPDSPAVSSENLEEILTLVAEEAVAEEIAEEIVAEELAEEIAEELAEEIVAEEIAEEMAEEVIKEDVADIMAVLDNAMTEEEAEEKIIAIIDTLPDTTPVSTPAQPQENIIRDIINPVIIEEVKPIQLRITIQPGDTAVFKRGTVLGMSCDAYSEVDNEVEFSWTKNGRFIDTTTGHVNFESRENGNIIIYNAGPADEGLYQCVASNTEGVVFSRVSKVRQRRLVSSRRQEASRSLAAPVWVVQPQALFQESDVQEDLQVVMGEPVPV